MISRRFLPLFAALFLLLFAIDLPLSEYINAHSTKTLRTVCRTTSYFIAPLFHLLLWPALLLLFWKKKKIRDALLLLSFNVLAVNTLVTFFKVVIGRPRPKLYYAEGIYLPSLFSLSGNYHSFPSRHTATIAAVIGFFCMRYPKQAPYLATATFLFTLARAGLNSHFLSDIAAGMLLGLSLAAITHYLYNLFFLEKHHES